MSGTPVNTKHEGRSTADENVAAAQTASLVLHIRPDPLGAPSAAGSTTLNSEPASVDALLESASLRVAACPDVYRGLARILSAGPETPVAVIVCVDELSPRNPQIFKTCLQIGIWSRRWWIAHSSRINDSVSSARWGRSWRSGPAFGWKPRHEL